jgi:hypothetical protein
MGEPSQPEYAIGRLIFFSATTNPHGYPIRLGGDNGENRAGRVRPYL